MSNDPNQKPKPEKPLAYKTLDAGWCAGQRVKKGDTVHLTPSQAKYERVELAQAETTSSTQSKQSSKGSGRAK